MLTFDELRKANVARCEQVLHPLDAWSPTDWACAFAGVCGEACNAVKKLRRMESGGNTTKDPSSEAVCIDLILMELADAVIYADSLAARLGRDLGEFVRLKFNVVSARMNSDITL